MNYPVSQQIYRSEDGVILGVMQGLADHFHLSVFWLRLLTLILFMSSGLVPMTLIYLAAAFIMKPASDLPIRIQGEHDFNQNYMISPRSAVHHLNQRYQDLEQRIGNIENIVTSKEFDFDRRLAASFTPTKTTDDNNIMP